MCDPPDVQSRIPQLQYNWGVVAEQYALHTFSIIACFKKERGVGGLNRGPRPEKAHRTTHLREEEEGEIWERRASDRRVESGSGVPKVGSGGWEVPREEKKKKQKKRGRKKAQFASVVKGRLSRLESSRGFTLSPLSDPHLQCERYYSVSHNKGRQVSDELTENKRRPMRVLFWGKSRRQFGFFSFLFLTGCKHTRKRERAGGGQMHVCVFEREQAQISLFFSGDHEKLFSIF